jgi:hypothetical protein
MLRTQGCPARRGCGAELLEVTYTMCSGFGTLVLKIAGSNPVEAAGFFGRKNPQHAFLRRGSKAVCPAIYVEVGIAGQIDRFSPSSVLH